MNKFVLFILIILLAFSIIGCAANSTTGVITVSNRSDIDAKNVKVGTNSIGFVGVGQVVNFYYVTEQTAATISADGFTFPVQVPALKGTIDLKFNYITAVTLSKNANNILVFNATASKVGSTNAADNIDMK
jgi:hypothetical protein